MMELFYDISFPSVAFILGLLIGRLSVRHRATDPDHFDSYLKDLEKNGSWNPHKNGANNDPSTSGWI